MDRAMLVSIIVTNYNYGSFLAEAVDSALGQTHDNVEVIVVDDGSTDGSDAIIRRYGDRVRPIFKANSGQIDSINVGCTAASGDVVIFLDADDTLVETAVEQHLASFEDPSVVVSHGYLEVVNADMTPLGRRLPFRLDPAGDYRERFLRYGPSAYPASFTSGGAWSRRFLEQALPMPPENIGIVGPDGYLAPIAPLFGRIGTVNAIVGRYRIHGSNRGPYGYSFTADYLTARWAAYLARLGFAAEWAQRMGYPVDPEHWADRAGWKLILTAYAAHLLDPDTARVPLSRLIAAPMRDAATPLHKRWACMLMLTAVGCSPRATALQMTKWILDRRWGRPME
jgi:glycosyltransferase involved in cell wall biosynthesis